MNWRDHIKVHPAAELFPLMSESELRELGEDIRKNGLLSPITIDGENNALIDGRNRLDAIALVGMAFEFRHGKGPFKGKIVGIDSDDFETPLDSAVRRLFETPPNDGAARRLSDFQADPYAFVIAANIHRRHLTEELRLKLIADVIKAKPDESDRAIAKQVKRDHKTVAKVRKKLESTGEVSPVEKRVGADGKKRPAKRKVNDEERDRKECVALYQKVVAAEVGFEEHRARMTALADSPSEPSDSPAPVSTPDPIIETDPVVVATDPVAAETLTAHWWRTSLELRMKFFDDIGAGAILAAMSPEVRRDMRERMSRSRKNINAAPSEAA